MKVKALVSFAGVVSMIPGEVREISPEIAKSLLKAKYIEEVIERTFEVENLEEVPEKATVPEVKPEKVTSKRSSKKKVT